MTERELLTAFVELESAIRAYRAALGQLGAAPPIALPTKRQTHIRIANLFIPTPLLQVVAGEPRIHVPSAPSRDLHSAFRKAGDCQKSASALLGT